MHVEIPENAQINAKNEKTVLRVPSFEYKDMKIPGRCKTLGWETVAAAALSPDTFEALPQAIRFPAFSKFEIDNIFVSAENNYVEIAFLKNRKSN